MTDYWQSQAKKFCDFCKCWITDNKPSIEFHERGKKHKENVARKIKEVHKRGVQVVKDNDELKRNLQAIEDAALEAYRKDVGEEAFIQATRGTTTTMTPPMSSHQKTYTHKEESKTTCAVPSSAGCTIVYNDGQPVAHCSHHWSIAQSPEGYYYYYNSKTLASQWEVPDCLQTEENDTTDEPSKQEQTQTQVSTSEKKEDKAEGKEKEIEENKDQGTKDKNTTSKTFSPYGAWTTVRTIKPPSNASKINDKEKTEESEELGENEDVQEDPEVTARKTENKFKEREMPKITFHKADDQVIAFKKRKLNNERKRNIRQTKFN